MFAILSVSSSVVLSAPMLCAGDSTGNLGKVDVASGAATLVGNMGHSMTDIAFDSNGNLYGITSSEF